VIHSGTGGSAVSLMTVGLGSAANTVTTSTSTILTAGGMGSGGDVLSSMIHLQMDLASLHSS
jgi:hypothetical protein